MGPYGSVWGDIKTGKRSMAYDHFWTPPDPKMGHKNPKMIKKSKIPKKMHFCWPLLLSTRGGGIGIDICYFPTNQNPADILGETSF